MVAQGEAIPVMGAFGGPLREEMLAQARKDICGNYGLWDFINTHATYQLCRWTRSDLAMCVTRPVRRMDIIVRGRPSPGVVWALYNSEWQGEDLTTPGLPLARGCIPT